MQIMYEKFVVGDRVRLKKDRQVGSGLSPDEIFTIGYIQDLLWPNHHYIDSRYWDDEKWEWARNKTRLDVAAHPQVVFLNDVLRPKMDVPPHNEDPGGKGRSSFSGAWFEKAT